MLLQYECYYIRKQVRHIYAICFIGISCMYSFEVVVLLLAESFNNFGV